MEAEARTAASGDFARLIARGSSVSSRNANGLTFRGDVCQDFGCAAKNSQIRSVAGTWLPLIVVPGHM